MHLSVYGDKLYVAEYLNDRIQVFSLDGKPLHIIGSSGSGPVEFDAPAGVAVGPSGTIFVADFYNQRVQVISPEGQLIRQLGQTGKKGIRAGRFNYPTDLVLLSDGKLVVADAYNDRIQIFDADGKFLRKWGGPLATNIKGSFKSWFKTATGVGVGPGDAIFVADFYNHRIQKFNKDGKFLSSTGEYGSGAGQFDRPTSVAVDNDGFLYVLDYGNHRIQKFSPIKE